MAEEESKKLKSQLLTAFSRAGIDDIPLEITGHQGYIKIGQGIPYRCYPYVNETRYDASYGTVLYESNHEDRLFEVVRFTGGTTSSGFSKYPDRIDSYELLGKIIMVDGEEGAADGGRENIGDPFVVTRLSGGGGGSVTYDDTRKVLVSDIPIFAVFKVYYFATYALIRYSPEETSKIGSGFWGYTYGSFTYGTIVAQLNTSIATFEVNPPTVQDNRQWSVLYEVTTITIANEDGQWEKPDLFWPTGGTPAYTGGTTDYPDPAQGYQQNSRIHQIARIDTDGFIDIEEQSVPQSDGPSQGTWLSQYGIFVGKKNATSLAGNPDFSAAVGAINSSDKGVMNAKLAKFGLDYDTMPE